MSGVTVKATCPECGDVIMKITELKLAIAGPSSARDRSFYSFVCKTCKAEVIKQASENVIAELSRAGVTTLHWTVPAEALEPVRWGPPLQWDDLLDFTLALDATVDLAALADLTSEPNA
jgi:hypothetical protein